MKQSSTQPTMMMLYREPQKTGTFLPFQKFIHFFQFWNNYQRQDHHNGKKAMNLHAIYIF